MAPLHPCSIMAHGDIAAAACTCDRVPPTLLPVCYQSLGRDITSFVDRNTRESARWESKWAR